MNKKEKKSEEIRAGALGKSYVSVALKGTSTK